MTRSITAQMRAAAASAAIQRNREPSTSEDESSANEDAHPPTPSTPPSLRVPLGSCNGVSSHHHQQQQQNGAHKRHQSLSPVPSGHENGGRAVTPPHTPPKLLHHNAGQNGHASPRRLGASEAHSRESSPPSRCAAPKSPPTPHRIKLLEEKENEKKPKKK